MMKETDYKVRELLNCLQFDVAVKYVASHPEQCCYPVPKTDAPIEEWLIFWSVNMLAYGYAHKMTPRKIKLLKKRILRRKKQLEKQSKNY